jgi:hypothetical protein
MRVDLSWLSDKSIPLFLAFMALQTTHELAHLAVAKSKNVSLFSILLHGFITQMTWNTTPIEIPNITAII